MLDSIDRALAGIAFVAPGSSSFAVLACPAHHRADEFARTPLGGRRRARFPELAIVVCYYRAVREFNRLVSRFRKVGASYLTTSLQQSAGQVALS